MPKAPFPLRSPPKAELHPFSHPAARANRTRASLMRHGHGSDTRYFLGIPLYLPAARAKDVTPASHDQKGVSAVPQRWAPLRRPQGRPTTPRHGTVPPCGRPRSDERKKGGALLQQEPLRLALSSRSLGRGGRLGQLWRRHNTPGLRINPFPNRPPPFQIPPIDRFKRQLPPNPMYNPTIVSARRLLRKEPVE